MKPLFDKVVIVGVGLIGSSIGMNLIKENLAEEVIGVGRNPENLQEAVRRKAIHRGIVGAQLIAPLLTTLAENDLVVLATPVETIVHYFDLLTDRPLVMDIGSTKRKIVKTTEQKKLRFVGAHPIAGTEKTGAAAGRADLFQAKTCFLTPTRFSRPKDLQKIKGLWQKMGSSVSLIKAEGHDRLLASVSHLPHAIAYSLMRSVGHLKGGSSAGLGGLKDMTRVAASSPEMWCDIFLQNKDYLLKSLAKFKNEIDQLKKLIARQDVKGLLTFLKKSRKARQAL